jgi:hypothetical protein
LWVFTECPWELRWSGTAGTAEEASQKVKEHIEFVRAERVLLAAAGLRR